MKTLRLFVALSLVLFAALAARAQFSNIQTNVTLQGSLNNVASGATFTISNGATFVISNVASPTNKLLILDGSGDVGGLGLGAGMSVVGGNLVAGSSTSANPSALVGTVAVNGVASSFMTSDSAPALNLAIAPTWTGLHTFAYTSLATGGSDYGLAVTPTVNQRNNAAFSVIYGNETVTHAGTGNQFLLELAVGGADAFTVDTGGNVLSGIWKGTSIGSAYGGTGQASFSTGAILCASASNTWGLLNPGPTGELLQSAGTGAQPAWETTSSVLDGIGTQAQGVLLERGSSAWQFITPGASGTVLMSNGVTSDESFQGPLSQIFTATGDIVYSSAGSTAARLAIGTAGQYLTVSGGVPSWATFAGLSNPMNNVNDLIVGGIAGVPTRLGVGTNGQFLGVSGGNVVWATPGGTTAANPTATIGLSAVNGSSGSFMRADAAPQLGTTIVPTWTGAHTWSGSGDMVLLTASGGNIHERMTVNTSSTAQAWVFGSGINVSNAFEIYDATHGGSDAISFANTTLNAIFGSTTASTTVSTGSIVTGGGIGAAGQVSCGNLLVTNTTTAATINASISAGGSSYTYGAPSTTGATRLVMPLQTYTVTGSATTANFQAVYHGVPTFTDSSAGTLTVAATEFFNGPPVAAGSLIITTPWTIYVNAGNCYFGGGVEVGGAAYSLGALPSGATTIGAAAYSPAQTYTVTGTNTATNFQAYYFGIPTFTDSSAGVVTNAATVFINGAPVAAGSITLTNKWSLYVSAGASYLGGSVTFGFATNVGTYPNVTYTVKSAAAIAGTVPIVIGATTYYVLLSTAQ